MAVVKKINLLVSTLKEISMSVYDVPNRTWKLPKINLN
jgi:hypothetical protein